jgi:hypothetical protein
MGRVGEPVDVAAVAAATVDIDRGDFARERAILTSALGDGADVPMDDRRLSADIVVAYLVRATGAPGSAVPNYRDLARRLAARFGPTNRRTLAAHADLALVLHEAGQCLTGRQILHRTRESYRVSYRPGDDADGRMLADLAALSRACGDHQRARDYVDIAQRLGDELPSVDTSLLRRVALAASAVGTVAHRCGAAGAMRIGSAADLHLGVFAMDVAGPVGPGTDRSGGTPRATFARMRRCADPLRRPSTPDRHYV